MSQSVKVILGGVIIIVIATLGFITMTKKQKVQTTPVATNQTETPAQEATKPEAIPVFQPAPKESQDKLAEVQALLTAGKITPEEAMKQMNDFNTKNQPVTAPAATPVPVIKK